jgi:hypothetical protein
MNQGDLSMKCIVKNCHNIAIPGSQLCQQHSDNGSAFRATDDASDQIIPDAASFIASDFSSSTDDSSSTDTSSSTTDFEGFDGGDSGGGGAGDDF